MIMASRIFIFLQCFTLLYLFAVTSASTEEATALLTWKATFQNQNNSLLDSWTLSPAAENSSNRGAASSGACRGWYGVICVNGRVNRLNISNAGVIGTLYEFPFSSLPFLDYVDLSINQLSGTIPPEIGKLTNLVYLDLSTNQISGTIPPQIGSLTKLETLYSFDNRLNGSIPTEIGKLKSLETLSLQTNNLSGPIPKTIGDLTELNLLYLYSNQLSGLIPSELGNLKKLSDMELSTNQFTGSIPATFGNLRNLLLI